MPEPARDSAPPTSAPPVNDTEPPASTGTTPGNDAFGLLAEGGFLAKLAPAGLRLSAQDLLSEGGLDLNDRPQPVPGVHLRRAAWEAGTSRLTVDAELRVPHLEGSDLTVRVDRDGIPSINGELRTRLAIPALGSPQVTLSLSEAGEVGGSVEIDEAALRPPGLRNLTVTGGGSLTLEDGRFSGNVDAQLAYAGLGSGEVHFAFSEAGAFSGSGSVAITPPFLDEITADLAIGADEADPSFTVSGELYIPAFVEGYLAFGAGLGLDVVLGSLTGGIEAVGTAGLYGAISAIPELAYEDGDWGIEGTATLAAGARLKLGLNAWA